MRPLAIHRDPWNIHATFEPRVGHWLVQVSHSLLLDMGVHTGTGPDLDTAIENAFEEWVKELKFGSFLTAAKALT